MSPDAGRELIRRVSTVIEEMFATQGQIITISHYKGDSGEGFLTSEMHDANEKEATAIAVRQILADENAVWVIVITEAWVVRGSKEEIGDIDHRKGLAEHPKREELVMYQLEDEDLMMGVSAVQEIVRPPDRPPHLGELKWLEPSMFTEGRLVGLLPRKKLSS